MANEGVGNQLGLLSLGGVIDRSERGRQSHFYQVTIPAGTTADRLLAPANARRLAVIVWRNWAEAGQDITVCLGPSTLVSSSDPEYAPAVFTLKAGGVLQIDPLFPWAGPVSVGGGALTTTTDIVLTASEIELP